MRLRFMKGVRRDPIRSKDLKVNLGQRKHNIVALRSDAPYTGTI